MGHLLKGRRVFLLAAGRGTRAGGPKALRPEGRGTALERHVDFLRTLFPADRLSVSIQPLWRAWTLELEPAARWVAADPDGSPLDSLLALLKDRPSQEWGFLYHVDMPVLERSIFETMSARAEEPGDAEAFIAAHAGRRGHPVLLSPGLYGELLRLDPGKDRLDRFLRSRKTADVELPSPAVLENRNA